MLHTGLLPNKKCQIISAAAYHREIKFTGWIHFRTKISLVTSISEIWNTLVTSQKVKRAQNVSKPHIWTTEDHIKANFAGWIHYHTLFFLPPVMSQYESRFPKFTKQMSPTGLSFQNVSTLQNLLFYDLLLFRYGI